MTILTYRQRSASPAADDSYVFTAQAHIVDTEKDTASAWATEHIQHNPSLKWIVGNYVEADNANDNGQYWTLDDLRLKGATVNHSPMNMAHDAAQIVGTYVASEMIYPSSASQPPYIETLAAMWKYYFPEQYDKIEEAFAEGTLFQSMECIADTVTCVGTEAACNQTFAYTGPWGGYCDHIASGESYRQLNNPTFVGGGLIIPPIQPGWKNAEINDVSKLTENAHGEAVYSQVEQEAPELDPKTLESIMQILVLQEASKSSNLEKARRAGRLLGVSLAATLNS